RARLVSSADQSSQELASVRALARSGRGWRRLGRYLGTGGRRRRCGRLRLHLRALRLSQVGFELIALGGQFVDAGAKRLLLAVEPVPDLGIGDLTGNLSLEASNFLAKGNELRLVVQVEVLPGLRFVQALTLGVDELMLEIGELGFPLGPLQRARALELFELGV